MKPLSKKYETAKEMYEKGLSIREIARFFGVTRQSMWDVLRRRGVAMRTNRMLGELNHFFSGGRVGDRNTRYLTEAAIKKGILKRKKRCDSCRGVGTMARNGRERIEAHHPDYNKPLDVMWLCQKCHHEWHKNNRAIPRREGR